MKLAPTVMLSTVPRSLCTITFPKERLDGRGQNLQLIKNLCPFISLFPKKASSRESRLFLVFSHHGFLP